MAKQDDWIKFTLRIPPELHARLVSVSGAASLNAEIIARLAASGEQRTLRDWFAGQAIGAIITGMATGALIRGDASISTAQAGADAAYAFADAMLAERAEAAPVKVAVSADIDLVEALRAMRGWVKHWSDDKAAGLAPTAESLASAAAAIDGALAKARA